MIEETEGTMDEDMARRLEEVEEEILFAARSTADPEDAAQELRIRVMQAVRTFDGGKSKWTTYVKNRIRFMLLDYLRSSYPLGIRSRDRPEIREQVTIKSLGESCSELVDDMCLESIEQVDSDDLLDTLEANTPTREIAMWCRGHKMLDIAKTLGVSESMVSQRIMKVRRDESGEIHDYVLRAAGR